VLADHNPPGRGPGWPGERAPAGDPESAARDERRRAALAALAPGTALRDGLERILRGNTGALVVVGDGPAVDEVCTGGFELHVPFSATRLRELAKMDGAIVLDTGAHHIVRAAVHLVPDPSLPTDESGTRHRTAERVARHTGCPVISVSKSMRIIALYLDGSRYVLEGSAAILSRANQALATLERYKLRLDEVSRTLTAHEIEDLATVRDVTVVAQRLEMVRRIAREIEGYQVELGTDGRLLALQFDELITGSDIERQLLVADYLPPEPDARPPGRTAAVLAELAALSPEELLEADRVATVLGLGGSGMLDERAEPRGYRLLSRIARLPAPVAGRLVAHFGSLQKLLAASVAELQGVDGVTEAHARRTREGLSRLAEVSLLERYS
jgi:diadenylate cyclase